MGRRNYAKKNCKHEYKEIDYQLKEEAKIGVQGVEVN